MKIAPRSLTTFASIFALLIAPLFLAPQARAQDTLTKAVVDREKRMISSTLEETLAQLNEASTRKDAGNLDSATVAGMRALNRLFEAAKLVDSHPKNIERLQGVFFSESTRKEYRAFYREKLRPDYFAMEKRIEFFAADLQKKGYSAVMVALGQLRVWMNTNDPAERKKAEEKFNKAITVFSKEGESLSDTSKKDSLDAIKGDSGSGSNSGQSGSGGSQDLGGGTTATSNDDGSTTVRGSDGKTTTIAGLTLLPDGKARTKSGEIVDLKGSWVDAQGNLHLADGRIINKHGEILPAPGPDKNSTFIGDEIPDDFEYTPDGIKGVNKRYAGEKGGRLMSEQQVTIKVTPVAGQANTFTQNRELGATRSWMFSITEVPGSRKKSGGSMTVSYAFTDRNGGTVPEANWEVSGPSGSGSVSPSSGAQVTVTFSASGTYTIKVAGKTDWKSPFAISASVQIDVN